LKINKLFSLLTLILSLNLTSCGEIQHCEYILHVEFLNSDIDTLRIDAFTKNQDLKIIENQLRFGSNFIFRDSVKNYNILKKTCFEQIKIPTVMP